MSDFEELLSRLPIDQIAGMLGTDAETARNAAEAVLPTLVAGMQSNAQDAAGAESLQEALAQHQNDLADGTVDAAQVDTSDGEKIVGHIFGGQEEHVANTLAGAANLGGIGGGLVKQLLPILAPIVMSWLAGKVFGGKGGTAAAGAQQGGGIDIGSILGSVLGGGQQGGGQAGGVLGSILGGLGGLGGLLGGGQQQAGSQQGGGIGDLLGGLFGGGQQPEAPQAAPQAPSVPQAPAGGSSLQPGEVIDVELPEGQAQQNEQQGGLGGLLGGLFGSDKK